MTLPCKCHAMSSSGTDGVVAWEVVHFIPRCDCLSSLYTAQAVGALPNSSKNMSVYSRDYDLKGRTGIVSKSYSKKEIQLLMGNKILEFAKTIANTIEYEESKLKIRKKLLTLLMCKIYIDH